MAYDKEFLLKMIDNPDIPEDEKKDFRAFIEEKEGADYFEKKVEVKEEVEVKVKKPVAKKKFPKKKKKTMVSAETIDKAKAAIKKRTGKTEEECEKIVGEYRKLRGKATKRKKKETERVSKLKKDGKVIKGTDEKTPAATIDTTARQVENKIEKAADKIERKAIKEVSTKNISASDKKEEVSKKVSKKIAAMTRSAITSTNKLISSTLSELKKVDKTEAKDYLLGLRAKIDTMLKKFNDGGMVQGYDIQEGLISVGNNASYAHGGDVPDYVNWEYPIYFDSEGKEYVAIYYSDMTDEAEADTDFDNRIADSLIPDVIKEHLGDNKWEEQDVEAELGKEEFFNDLEYALETSSISSERVDYAHGGDVSDAKNRLEELRIELRREMISYGELIELESLKHHIDKDDVELRQAAGMKEMSETYIVDVVWRQLDEKGLGKFNLKESDIERLEDNYGSTYYFEVYDDTNENPISYIQMKNILDKSMKDMGLMDSNYAKGGEIKKGNKYQLFNYDINGMTNYEIVDLGKVKNIEQVYLKPLDAENRKEIVIPKKMFLDILSKNKYAKGGRWTNKTEL